MPMLVDGSQGASDAEPTAVAHQPRHDQLVGEEIKRTRAASDGDTRQLRGKPKQFSVVAVDESRSTALPPPSSSRLPPSNGSGGGGGGALLPPGALPPAAHHHTAGSSVNGAANGPAAAAAPPNGEAEDTGHVPAARNTSSAAAHGAVADRAASVTIPVLTLSAASDKGSSSSTSDSQHSNGGNGASTTTAPDESTVSLVDEQATIGGGVQQRIHYRKLREKASSTLDVEQANGSGGAKLERLTVPTAASYHNSLPASGPWNYPPLLGAGGAAPRNISTLSLTLLLRDQRRKNLAMLARLFASRQKEKDMLDGTGGAAHAPYQDLMTESKKKRCQVTSMQVAVASLFCILLALVTTSVLLFAPNRNIYRSQAGFVFDKDTRLLTVQNSTGYPLLQILTGVDLRGLPYNCSTPGDLRNHRRCWKWSPSNVTLRVNVVNLSNELTCVDVTWQTTSVEPLLHDCIALGAMQWYGGSSSRLLPWSLNAALASAARADANAPSTGAGRVLYAPGEVAGTLAARAWISTAGALVAAHGYAPLYLRLQGAGTNGPAFCLSSWSGYERGQLHSLNYTACVAADAPTAHRHLIESQRASAAWTSEDSSAVADMGAISPAYSAAGRDDDDDESPPVTGATTTPSLDPEVEAEATTARAAADASSSAAAPTAVAATASSIASRARWSSAIVKPDPVWIVRADNGADVLNQIVSRGFATSGTFLVRESSLSDPGRAVEAIESVSRRARALNVTGLSFGLTVSAFVSVSSDLFLDRRYETLWMRTARSSLPVLVRDDSVAGGSASMLVDPASDLAYEVSGRRLSEIAGVVRNNFSSTIGMLYVRAGIAAADLDLQAYLPAAQDRLLSYPLWYARLGADLVSSLMVGSDSGSITAATLLVDGATTGLAGYSLSESVQQGSLAEIVRHILVASVSGDPPSSIGPFAAAEVATLASETDEMDTKSRYIRWMQLAAFAPVMMFDSPPWEHGEDVVNVAQRILAYRQAEIMPRLRRLYEAFGRTGEPVYKPLWWNDSLAATVKASKLATQFFLDDLMVAPVVDHKPYRLIYFPTGFWLDQSQKLFIGPGTHNYTIDPTSMPVFLRKTTGIHEKGIPEADVGLRR